MIHITISDHDKYTTCKLSINTRIFEITNLPSTTVICYTKSIFAKHGILNVFRSDNGPQVSSDEFKQLIYSSVSNGDSLAYQ